MGQSNVSYVRNRDGSPGRTWPIVTGCSGDDCEAKRYGSCWAEGLIRNRLSHIMKGLPEDDPFRPTLHERLIEVPLQTRKPTCFFVAHMGDLFDRQITDAHRSLVFSAMIASDWRRSPSDPHTFLVLTKQAERLRHFVDKYALSEMHSALWIGVSICTQSDADRCIPHLNATKTFGHKWLSVEPMVGPVDISEAKDIKAVVVGCESGNRARVMDIKWVRPILDYCQKNGIRFYFKQANHTGTLVHEPELDGVRYNMIPWYP